MLIVAMSYNMDFVFLKDKSSESLLAAMSMMITLSTISWSSGYFFVKAIKAIPPIECPIRVILFQPSSPFYL